MGEQATAQVAKAVVVSPPAGGMLMQRTCACGTHTIGGAECAECKKKADSGKTLQRMPTNPAQVDQVPPIVHEVLRSPGQPLDASTRAFMEPRLAQDFTRVQTSRPHVSQSGLAVGAANDPLEREADKLAEHALRIPSSSSPDASTRWSMGSMGSMPDFSRVRVHTDARAADSSRAVNALAYTVGNHIVFGGGSYSPSTTAGRRLLAHELTHTMQQSSSPAMVQRACDPTTGPLSSRTSPIFFPLESDILGVFTGAQTLSPSPTAKPAVGLVQQALVDVGINMGTGGPNSNGVTDVFNADTTTGVTDFQTRESIPGVAAGVVDQPTLKCLDDKRSAVVVQPHQATATPSDVRVRNEQTGGRDEDIMFNRGDAVLDAGDKAKIGRLLTRATNPLQGCAINLEGFVSEDELVEFGAALATTRINAVGAEFAAQKHDDPGPACTTPVQPLRTASRLPAASSGVSDYRARRKVEVVPAGAASTTAPCPQGAARFRSLTGPEGTILKDAIKVGKKWMKKAIDRLTPGNSEGNAALTAYFGGTSLRSTIRSNLTTWRNHLSNVVSVNNRHGTACNSTCRVATAFNTGVGPTAQMTLCPPFFQSIPAHTTLPEDERKAFVIMHEAGHGSIGTRDTAYGHRRLIEFLADYPAIAETNTDSYTLLVLCLNDVAGFCTPPTTTDTAPTLTVPEQIKSRRGLGWLQTWLTWAEQDTASMYGKLNTARETGQGLRSVNSYYADVFDVMVAAFNIRRPAGDPPPTFGEQTMVAGILDRLLPMKLAAAEGLTVEKDTSATPTSSWDMGPGRQVFLADAYFVLTTDRERVEHLLPLIVHAHRMISVPLEPNYETYIKQNVVTSNNNRP